MYGLKPVPFKLTHYELNVRAKARTLQADSLRFRLTHYPSN
jgi:hypothetical protein